MKLLLFALVLGTAAFGAPVEKLTDFELADQNLKTRIYRFPKSKVTVMTVADHKGSGELAPWIQRLHDRYQKKIDIDGVADVSKIPKPLHAIFRAAFRKQLAYSVMLDWETDSRPRNNCLHPLLAAASRSSSSWAAWMVAWLLHHLR